NLLKYSCYAKKVSEAYSDQQVLEDAIRLDLSRGQYDNHLKHMRRVARKQGLDKIFNDYEVDIIIGPCDSSLPSLASGSGTS
ncbi:hypothetical protein NK983_33605, partial [Salmonella enterica subsp. enterica serovar Typhimurium]|nr:hypothetical protein [Salmonella enterica subsp. enterica serovar Typhimurium]